MAPSKTDDPQEGGAAAPSEKAKEPDEAVYDPEQGAEPHGPLVDTRSALKVAGVMSLHDPGMLSLRVHEVVGNATAAKMLITRAVGLESENAEQRDSVATLTAQVSKLKERFARLDEQLKQARTELAMQRQLSRTREIVGGIGLAACSAGISLVFTNLAMGIALALVGGGVAAFAVITTRGATEGRSNE